MIEIKNLGKTNDYVYDISLDGSVVNALGNNIASNTDGFNFQLPNSYRYNDDNPYIGKGLNRNVKEGKRYTGFEADVAEFNDLYMRGKMGLGIDEVVSATINFSRKNYADYFPENKFPEDVKMVGNTIKSKKMPEYISKFLSKGIRLLLQNKGQEFINEYYSYIEKIYNLQIPLKDIASKGKVKKTIEEYIEDCKTLTKAGRPKSRQAWMELAMNANMKVDLGDTIYYINTGTSKSHSDVKKVTNYYIYESSGEKVNINKEIEKEFRIYKKEAKDNKIEKNKILKKENFIEMKFPKAVIEYEIILNSILLPREVIDSETDCFCDGKFEYNVSKYIDQFNKRITPLLVCFSPDIRSKILIENPEDRQYFTDNESALCSGYPNKPTDQDTYEQLMTMEDKEIKFWSENSQLEAPFVKECDMDWEEIVNDYNDRIENEKKLGINIVRDEYQEIIDSLTAEEIEDFMEGKLPSKLEKIVDIDPVTSNFISKKYPDIIIGNINDLLETNLLEKDDF